MNTHKHKKYIYIYKHMYVQREREGEHVPQHVSEGWEEHTEILRLDVFSW